MNCSASDGGGAIYFSSGTSSNVSGCSFVNCSNNYGGGAICFYSGTSGVVSGCSFVNCSNNYGGGAICFQPVFSSVICFFIILNLFHKICFVSVFGAAAPVLRPSDCQCVPLRTSS